MYQLQACHLTKYMHCQAQFESDDKEDIENLMKDSNTKFIDESLIENGGSKSNLPLSTSCLDIENHLNDPNTPTPIEAVVR